MALDTMKLVNEGVNKAVSGLAGMVGKEISIFDFDLKKILVKDVPFLFGGPEALMVGVYLQVSGDTGNMLVGYEPETASELISMMLGQAPESMYDLTEMERSVLGEVGNIMGSFFLNTIAEGTGISLMPSPPAVMADMAGAILDAPLATMLKKSNETLIVTATFGTADKHINGKFIVAPVPVVSNT
jgi:chemotaxis protein CheC